MTNNPSAKRSKTHVLLKDVLSNAIMEQQQALMILYSSSKPYSHCILENVFQASFFDNLVEEIKKNSKVTFKESDLFKFYQSIDLANLQVGDESLADSMPSVLQLRQVLYSDEWRHFIEKIAGLEAGTLNHQVDCACNCHVNGCHLLCHDDVIGTRKVSYILYMTDPDWKREEGGALELYGADSDRLPTLVPAACTLPMRNSMAFFIVEPGVSFHAVQEVLGNRPRLSLQGWYHAKEPPLDIQDATLQRLKTATRSDPRKETVRYRPFSFPPERDTSSTATLCEEDRIYLSSYIDETYLQLNALEEMRASFENDSSIQLRSFLNRKFVEKICLQESRLSVTDEGYYNQGVTNQWRMVGPPHMQRYLRYVLSDDAAADGASLGGTLDAIRRDLLQSTAFANFLSAITSLRPLGYSGEIRRFRPGLDYTVAHCGLLTETPVLDTTLCFVAGTGRQQILDGEQIEAVQDEEGCGKALPEMDGADIEWQLGDVGGFECYIEADEAEDGGEAADEYNEDDGTELLSVSAAFNTLSIVLRDPGTLRFVKYVSAKAPSSRWDIAMEYEIDGTDDSDSKDKGSNEDKD